MVYRLPAVVVSAFVLLGSAQALLLPVTAQLKRTPNSERRRSAQTGMLTLGDQYDTSYVTQITAGGSNFVVTVDTGSSDLNIMGTVPGADDQANINIPVTFAVGEMDGIMSFSDVQFGGYSVQDQIFNHLPASQDSANDGLLGLGPSYASVLWNTAQPYIKAGQLPHNAGDSLLDRIFQSDSSSGNCIAVYMSRNDDPSSSDIGQGYFSISEVLTQYKQVMSMPMLPVVQSSNMLEQHFAVVLDAAIGNNGQQIALPTSSVSGVPAGKLVAVFDTGYSFPQIPPAITTAIYSGIPGAKQEQLSDGGIYWTLPCTEVVNAAFVFAGYSYPIHPLDLNFDPTGLFNGIAPGTCIGAFQPMTDDAASALDGQADMILGMAFLRNVYSLFNYGDWTDSTMDAQYEPFVQLLSITDPNGAATEFNQVRGGGGSSSGHLTKPEMDLSVSPAVSQTINTVLDWIKSHLYIVIPAAVGALVAVALLISWCCCCCRRNRRYQNLSAPAPGYAPSPNPDYRYGSSPYSQKQQFDMGYTYAARSAAPAYDDPYTNRALLEK